jgi:hypothetical protein
MFLKVFKKYFALFISKKVPADISQKDEGDTVSLEYIQNIHDNIQNMIKFGEAKNGALLTINLGVFLKLAHSNFIYTSLMLTVFSVIAIASIVLSILVLLFSFIPKLNFQKTFNPIFFGSISKLDRNAFLKDVDKLKEKELVAYYWEQIHINSNIAMSKFVYFKRGVFLTILSFMSYGLINIIK